MFNPKHIPPSPPAREAGFMYVTDRRMARRQWRMSMGVVILTAVASAAAGLGLHLPRTSGLSEAARLPHVVLLADPWPQPRGRS